MSPAQKPIQNYITDFLDYCEIEKGLSSNTQRNYKQYLNLFVRWLKETSNASLLPKDLTTQHIWDYRLYIARKYKTPRGSYLTKKSQNYYLIALRALLDYFADRDIETISSAKIKLAKHDSSNHISFLEVYEIENMLALFDTSKVSGLRDRTILELFFSSGMRISELTALDKRQFSFLLDKRALKQSVFELSITGKGNHTRTIFISTRAADWLRKYLETRVQDDYKPLFINYRTRNTGSKRLTPRSIQMMISKYAGLAGITKKVTPHTFRHSYATDLLGHGADLRSVQELLGHKNVATTQVYTHVTNKQLRDVHEKFHGGKDMQK